MSSAMTNVLIAVGITSGICYALMTHVQNRSRRRARAGAGADGGGDSYSGITDGFTRGSWFSGDHSPLDSSGNTVDGGSCFSGGDGDGGGDCGGGGDGGGGGD